MCTHALCTSLNYSKSRILFIALYSLLRSSKRLGNPCEIYLRGGLWCVCVKKERRRGSSVGSSGGEHVLSRASCKLPRGGGKMFIGKNRFFSHTHARARALFLRPVHYKRLLGSRVMPCCTCNICLMGFGVSDDDTASRRRRTVSS